MLELRDLRKRFGAVVALDGCSFSARPGRILGLVGPNGAGKTTSMRSIFGLVRLDGGEVRWHDGPVDLAVRQRAGYMPEERGLYPRMRVGDQVAYFARLRGLGRGDAEASARSLLERLELADRVNSRVEELSHGNQQRVQLAVALVSRPDLLVLDEPFAGLDPIGVKTMAGVIRAEADRGAVVIFSSHQLELVEDLCDDIAIVSRGRIALEGGLAEIRARSESRFLEITFAAPVEAAKLEAWMSEAAGLELLSLKDNRARLRAPATADFSALAVAARAAGEVVAFRYEPPNLVDIFIEATQR